MNFIIDSRSEQASIARYQKIFTKFCCENKSLLIPVTCLQCFSKCSVLNCLSSKKSKRSRLLRRWRKSLHKVDIVLFVLLDYFICRLVPFATTMCHGKLRWLQKVLKLSRYHCHFHYYWSSLHYLIWPPLKCFGGPRNNCFYILFSFCFYLVNSAWTRTNISTVSPFIISPSSIKQAWIWVQMTIRRRIYHCTLSRGVQSQERFQVTTTEVHPSVN